MEVPASVPHGGYSSSSPDLSYTKSNINFLRDRLGDLKEKNRELHDRYSKLEESALSKSGSDRPVKMSNGSSGGQHFENLTDISMSRNPLGNASFVVFELFCVVGIELLSEEQLY